MRARRRPLIEIFDEVPRFFYFRIGKSLAVERLFDVCGAVADCILITNAAWVLGLRLGLKVSFGAAEPLVSSTPWLGSEATSRLSCIPNVL